MGLPERILLRKIKKSEKNKVKLQKEKESKNVPLYLFFKFVSFRKYLVILNLYLF